MKLDKNLAILIFVIGWLCYMAGDKVLKSKSQYRYFGWIFVIVGIALVALVLTAVAIAIAGGAL